MRLEEKYKKEVIAAMKDNKFGCKNVMAAPKIKKVVLNVGFGKSVVNKTKDEQRKLIETILHDLVLIAGQRPVFTRAKQSIAGFKVRKGMIIGAAVTLRKKMMYDFLERLIKVVIPRVRDFKGIERSSFDDKGNLTIGIKEHIVFPEVFQEKAKQIFSLEVTVVTAARNKEEGIELLKLMGFPIKKD